MKVFISWSGESSRRIAEALFEWLPMVLQSVRPYMSSESIDKGTRWASSISNELEGSSVGILIMTPGNTGSPWIHFEAGALAKVVGDSKLAPLLFGLKPSEIGPPLSQFQVTLFTKGDILKLLQSINLESGEEALPDSRLARMHDALWDQLDRSIAPILADIASEVPGTPKTPEENNSRVLEEILTVVRQTHLLMATNREISLATNRDSVEDIARVLGSTIGGGPFSPLWSEASIAELKDLWSKGSSATEISEKLGISRNAVIGKTHRLGLRFRPASPSDDGES